MTISNEPLLKRFWKGWLKFGYWLGNIMSWVWMPLFYFVIAMPFALIVKLFADPLQVREGRQKSYWTPKELPKLDMKWAQNQGSISQKK